MTAISIEPLRKLDTEGVLYVRLPEIEAKLVEIYALSPEDVAARCAIHDRDNPDYSVRFDRRVGCCGQATFGKNRCRQ